ncbi:tRNA-splicing endonuclease subunit [Marasmius crinis-equi]|uniref:tRNA-splicing endonuclease subunit Sen34 n=1 Tax=Marasmius crinis-equi TaxID=585013 RepID=A0ABR3FXH6_9AGAR
MSETTRIPIRITNKRAFVWDVDDIAKLRSEHHICGLLSGTLPHLSQQNVFLGVPLLLSPEEVVLLVEKKIAVLVDDPNSYPQPTTPQFQQWLKEQQEHLKQQLATSEVKNAKDTSSQDRAMSEEAIRKRKERELKRQQKAAQIQQQALADEGKADTPIFAPVTEEATQPQPQTAVTTVVIPAPSSSLPWYSPESHAYDFIETAKEAGIWEFPSNLHERARCGIFKDLWEQGYFMGGGIKFGSEYLVYPGDPLRYHSHFAATVIDSPTAVLRPMEIVAHGRLGTATKKTHLLCCWDDTAKSTTYLSIEWAGFG